MTSKRDIRSSWLHGGGGVGEDNVQQISNDQRPGTRTWTQPANQAAHPAFVLAPQSVEGWGLRPALLQVFSVIESVKSDFSIDAQRIYVAGQSIGGGGTWSLITSKPQLFAAAILLCPLPGDSSVAARVAPMPIWIFQGDADSAYVVAGSRALVAAIRKVGGTPRYSEYKGVGHEIWERVFKEPGLVDWLFAQHR